MRDRAVRLWLKGSETAVKGQSDYPNRAVRLRLKGSETAVFGLQSAEIISDTAALY